MENVLEEELVSVLIGTVGCEGKFSGAVLLELLLEVVLGTRLFFSFLLPINLCFFNFRGAIRPL